MALIKYGGGIIQMSGSIAGNTHARNRFGNYMRARTKPVNPNSARQITARARVALLAEDWSTVLTAVQRAAWATYAAAISWLNKLGETVQLTGFNHFIRTNCVRLEAGLGVLAVAPTDLTLANQDPTFTVALTAAAGLTLTFDDTLDWASEDDGCMVVDLGQPQNPSRNFFGGPWRFERVMLGNTAAPLTSPQGPFALSAWTLVSFQLIWVQAAILRADGRLSNKFGPGPITVG